MRKRRTNLDAGAIVRAIKAKLAAKALLENRGVVLFSWECTWQGDRVVESVRCVKGKERPEFDRTLLEPKERYSINDWIRFNDIPFEHISTGRYLTYLTDNEAFAFKMRFV